MTQAIHSRFSGLSMLTFTVVSFTAATIALMVAAGQVSPRTPMLEPITVSATDVIAPTS